MNQKIIKIGTNVVVVTKYKDITRRFWSIEKWNLRLGEIV